MDRQTFLENDSSIKKWKSYQDENLTLHLYIEKNFFRNDVGKWFAYILVKFFTFDISCFDCQNFVQMIHFYGVW